MPYMKFRNWYVPNCEIAFPTEEEAWEYLEEMEQENSICQYQYTENAVHV